MSEFKKISTKNFIKTEHPMDSIASFPAMPMVQNNQKFYLATIPAEEIFPFCFVTRRESNAKDGFQRNLSEQRALDIANYLDNSKGSIPTNIVLSSQPEAEIAYNSKSKTVKYKRNEKAFLVIDGQHRLFGYGLTKKNIEFQ